MGAVSEAMRKGWEIGQQLGYGQGRYNLTSEVDGKRCLCALGFVYLGAFGEPPIEDTRDQSSECYDRLVARFPELRKGTDGDAERGYLLRYEITNMNDRDELPMDIIIAETAAWEAAHA